MSSCMVKAVTLAFSIAVAWPAAAQDIRLTGVLISGPASMAIITGPDGRDKVVRIGQEINAGTTLGEVSSNGIVVLRNQRREWLPLVGGNAAAPVQFSGGPAPKLTDPATASQAGEVAEPRRAKADLTKQMGAVDAGR
jgi:hypothetical protein